MKRRIWRLKYRIRAVWIQIKEFIAKEQESARKYREKYMKNDK